MSANPEPLAVILADYRADIPAMTSGKLPHPTPEYLRIMLDRIEAAAERERRKYQRLHECFWEPSATQSIVRQMLDEAADLRSARPKESDNLAHFAHALIECAKPAARAPGNAAALREALVGILDRTNREKARDYDAALNGGILEIHDIANTALNQERAADSAPPRNCDRFATAAVASAAFRREHPDEASSDFAVNLIYWLFAPAEGETK